MFTIALQILVDIQNTSGTKKKMELIQSLNPEIKEILKKLFIAAFDPFVVSHLNKISIPEKQDPIFSIDSNPPTVFEFENLINELKSAKSANNELRNKAASFCSRIYDNAQRDILVKVLTKKLNIGISSKNINKIFPNLIFNRSVMLASSQDSLESVKEWSEGSIVVDIKFDGVRIIAQRSLVDNIPQFKFYTRSFNEIPSEYLKQINDELLLLDSKMEKQTSPSSYFLDGELTSKQRTITSGEITKMLCGTYITTEPLVYNIFDFVKGDVFKTKSEETESLKERYKELYEFFFRKITPMAAKDVFTSISFIPHDFVDSIDEIMDCFKNALENGEEGLIVKNLNAKYEFKRSKSWIKMKAIKTADLKIIGFIPGASGTKFNNTLGSITCRTSDDNLEVNIGTGLSEKQRNEIWNNRDKLIGKIIEVEYNEIIKNKRNDIASLFLPRFKQFREDKHVANSLEELS